MPQMSPMNWITLMTFFTLTLMMFAMMNYYSLSYKNNKSTNKNKSSKINWKW